METHTDMDTLYIEHADEADRVEMEQGCHFDYVAQTWRDGHDHAHFADDDSPLWFCGADRVTCEGQSR